MARYAYGWRTCCCLYLRITWPIAQISVTSFDIDQLSTAPSCCYAEETAFFAATKYAKRCMNEKTIQCLPNSSQHVPIYLQRFPSYSNRKCKKSPFSRTAAHIFVSPGDAPAIITNCVAWMERQFNACQTTSSICLSITACTVVQAVITGSAVALHCCKDHAKINGKIENSTPCKIVTHEDFNLKLGTRD